MARDTNGYDDLLSMFDSEAEKKVEEKASEKKEAVKRPSAPPVKEAKSSMSQRFNRDMEDISSNSAPENNGKKSGVYFANPPRNIKNRAAREQGLAINGETKRKMNKRSQALKESARVKEK